MRRGKLFQRKSGPEPDDVMAGPDATTAALAAADDLARAGRAPEAVDLLVEAQRRHPDPRIEIRTLRLREAAAEAVDPGAGRAPWPPVYPDPFPDVRGALPEIEARDLTVERLGGAVTHHGALIVRNLLGPEDVRRLIAGIDRAEAERDRAGGGPRDAESTRWYDRYPQRYGPQTRAMVEKRGNVWLADSPANAATVLDLLAARGVIGAVAAHLGERPCFSLQKSTLRHVRAVPDFGGWHQDGAFLGDDVRTMNVWVALTPCGGDLPTPGLEVVPRRIDEILSTEGGFVAHSVDPGLIDRVAGDTPPVRPEFGVGDGVLFDERFLHSTYLPEQMTEDRYALECWLFAPSHRSPEYLPFLV